MIYCAYVYIYSKYCLTTNTALMCCCTAHVAPPSHFLPIRKERRQRFLYKHLAPDWLEWDSKVNLLLWDTGSCAASFLLSWQHEEQEAGLRAPWRWSGHVWCLMMKAWKSGILLNNTLWIIFCLAAGEVGFFCKGLSNNVLWEKNIIKFTEIFILHISHSGTPSA